MDCFMNPTISQIRLIRAHRDTVTHAGFAKSDNRSVYVSNVKISTLVWTSLEQAAIKSFELSSKKGHSASASASIVHEIKESRVMRCLECSMTRSKWDKAFRKEPCSGLLNGLLIWIRLYRGLLPIFQRSCATTRSPTFPDNI
jgi:hypothetical protein